METKACVYCGTDVQCEEAVASYVEFPDVDTYVMSNPYPPTMDDKVDSLVWWLHAWIPMHDEYADVYALCLECSQHAIDGEAWIPIEALIPFENAWDKLPPNKQGTCADCGIAMIHTKNDEGLCAECRRQQFGE